MAVRLVEFAVRSADFVFVGRAVLEERAPKSMSMMLVDRLKEEKSRKKTLLVKNPLSLKKSFWLQKKI